MANFVEIFLSSVWSDRKDKIVLDSFFCVPPSNAFNALPKPAPQGVLAGK